MRVIPPLLAIVFALCGCGDDHASGPTACELGPDILSEALAALHQSQPKCTSDDDCVHIRTDVDCRGFSYGGCGTTMHRKTAASWDPRLVCDEIERASAPSELACSIDASCADTGRPACRAARCVGANDRP